MKKTVFPSAFCLLIGIGIYVSCQNVGGDHPQGIPPRYAAVAVDTDSIKYEEGKDGARMILVSGGSFSMGSDRFTDAQPVHDVEVSPFWIDEHEVTNRQFLRFVEETGYITVAERELNPEDFPGVSPSMLVPGSAVFAAPEGIEGLQNYLQWWQYIPGASWKHPEGPESTIVGIEDHPVTQIAYEDAKAYAQWAGKRLPTEAEWEFAAKAGHHTDETYYWGNILKEDGKWLANIFQGDFPIKNSLEDGYATTSPVKSFPANSYGIYDMEGNVWEWCEDYYRPGYDPIATKDPKGPVDSYDPQEPGAIKRVQRGGSFLCNDQYCERYKAGARGKGEINSPTNNVGFRCVRDAE